MKSFKGILLSGTVLPLLAGVGALAASAGVAGSAGNPMAVPKTSPRANPAAVSRLGPTPVQIAACGAKKGCNPCGAKKGCNPCGGGGAANTACNIPRLAAANPGAAKKGCNPCGPKKGCNPCGAKKGCNPCGGAAPMEIKPAEAKAAYDCLIEKMQAAYAKSGDGTAKSYAKWKRYNTVPYVSATHGSRYVNNYANRKGKDYGKFEKIKSMPVGAVLAKDSFQVKPKGRLALGPLFIMEKMKKGFNKASGDWRYKMIMPDGSVYGTTKGKGTANVKFCYECHLEQSDHDSLLFIPEEVRVGK